jgi:hypothetical protein
VSAKTKKGKLIKPTLISLSVLLFIQLLAITSFAAAAEPDYGTTASLSTTTASVTAGDTVYITVSLAETEGFQFHGDAGLANFECVLNFDNTYFTPDTSYSVVDAECLLTTGKDIEYPYAKTASKIYYYAETAENVFQKDAGTSHTMKVVTLKFTTSSSTPAGDYEFSFDPNKVNCSTEMGGGAVYPVCTSTVKITVSALVDAALPTIDTQPTAQTTNVRTSVNLSVAASKTDAGVLSYQWYTNGTTNSNIGGTPVTTGGMDATYAPDVTTAGTTYYYCVVTNTNYLATGAKTATATSDAVLITVNSGAEVSFTIVGSTTSPNLRFVNYTTAGITYHIIRGLNPLGEKVNAVMSYFKVENGSWKLYKWATSTSTYSQVTATDTISVVGTNFKIEIYDNSNSLVNTYYIAIFGDLNADGKITNADTAIVSNHVSTYKLITNKIISYAADVNSSSTITNADTAKVSNHVSSYQQITQ